MKKQILNSVLIAIFISFAFTSFAQDKVFLEYNLKKGKTYTNNLQSAISATQQMMGQEMKSNTVINAISELVIENVDKQKNATVKTRFISGEIKSSGSGKDTTINMSEVKDLKQIIFAKNGKINSSTDLDTTKKRIGIPQDFSKLEILPCKEVKIGEKWTNAIKDSTVKGTENPFETQTSSDMEYTLSAREIVEGNSCFKVDFTGKMTINGKGSQMGMEMFIEGGGKISGFYYFDPKQGIITFSESTTEMELNISIAGQQSMVIPVTQSIKNINKYTEKK